jgi:UDP-N-acetylmuramoyl-tripeptide--D-alanyl-D-alanine ligase
MKVHLLETYQGRHWITNPITLIKWLLLGTYFLVPFTVSSYYSLVVLVVFMVEIFLYVIKRRRILYPHPFARPKPLFVLTFSVSTIIFLALVVSFDYPVGFSILIADLLLPIIVFIAVLLTWPPFMLLVSYKTKKAVNYMQTANNLKIIGVTGSYGKSTTKEYIYQILKTKYNVFKTPASHNTNIGIAETILSHNLSEYDYFICEVAAYKRGEIRDCVKLFAGKLKIAVITGINEQHQSLFGSMDNTRRAKFELVEALSKDGVMVINSLDSRTKEMVVWANHQNIRTVSVKKAIKHERGVESIFGINKALAVQASKLLGILTPAASLQTLSRLSKTMTVEQSKGYTIIDDSFNANPDAVYSAFSYLKKKEGIKYLVLQPLIELGKYAYPIHKKIGFEASKIFDGVVLTNKNFYEGFSEGFYSNKKSKSKLIIGQNLDFQSPSSILFEGKESETYIP